MNFVLLPHQVIAAVALAIPTPTPPAPPVDDAQVQIVEVAPVVMFAPELGDVGCGGHGCWNALA